MIKLKIGDSLFNGIIFQITDKSVSIYLADHNPGKMSWTDANNYCKNLYISTEDLLTTWRLPTSLEMYKLPSNPSKTYWLNSVNHTFISPLNNSYSINWSDGFCDFIPVKTIDFEELEKLIDWEDDIVEVKRYKYKDNLYESLEEVELLKALENLLKDFDKESILKILGGI